MVWQKINREPGLLWNTADDPSYYKQRVLSVIAHEFSHMWFGNLVTCDWWDYNFLNEGFARYFQYFTIPKLLDLDVGQKWEMAKQFIIERQQITLTLDATKESQALTKKSASPLEVTNKFDSIIYNKGACIIRMLENVMGSKSFFSGLNAYLKANAYSTTVPNKLWSALEPFVPPEVLPPNVTLVEVMENWINASGFPLVTVNVKGNDIVLSQERFIVTHAQYDDTMYYIPITYTTSNQSNPFLNVTPTEWLTPTTKVTLNDVLQTNSWFVLNNQDSAYYRVNYDHTLWDRITIVLRKAHTKIHVMNRAKIVDDAFNLARAGIIDYSQTFSILSYLKCETEYFPWYSAINGFDFLQNIYGADSETGKRIIQFEKELIQGVLNSVSFSKLNEFDHVYSLKLSKILSRACKLGVQSCIASSLKLFRAYKAGISVDKNLKACVYCNGLRHSITPKTDFWLMWRKFKNAPTVTEKQMILSAIGCSRDPEALKIFLDKSFFPQLGIRLQDFLTLWSGVYTAGPEGIDTALEFFLENHERIFDYSQSLASTIFAGIANRIYKRNQLKKLETVVSDTNVRPEIHEAMEFYFVSAWSNYDFATERKKQIDAYFDVHPTVTTICKNSGRILKSPVTLPVFIIVSILFFN